MIADVHSQPHESGAGALADRECALGAELERGREHTERAEAKNAAHKVDHSQLAGFNREDELSWQTAVKLLQINAIFRPTYSDNNASTDDKQDLHDLLEALRVVHVHANQPGPNDSCADDDRRGISGVVLWNPSGNR